MPFCHSCMQKQGFAFVEYVNLKLAIHRQNQMMQISPSFILLVAAF